MRIESVTAHAFGPLAGRSLAFAPGMTVVHGPNESAKSSWHAAILAALCGRRRGDREFQERHQPWDSAEWLVEADLVLDDGRRVTIRQDLLNRVDRRAFDRDLGRVYSDEVMSQGHFLDAARWLGLDRDSFRATAWVSQAQILRVAASANDLSAFIQAAVESGGEVPMPAIAVLEEFRRANVGTPRMANPPLVRATREREAATAALAAARAVHAGYEALLAAADAADRAAAEARLLAARDDWAAAEELARQDRAAADAASRLDVEAQTLVDPPGAPVVVPPSVVAAVDAALAQWDSARAALETSAVSSDESTGSDLASEAAPVSDDALRGLIADLEFPIPAVDPAHADEATAAAGEYDAAQRALRGRQWLATGAVLTGLLAALALGLGLAADSAAVAWMGTAAALAVATVLLAATGIAAAPRRRVATALEDLGRARAAVAVERSTIERVTADRAEAVRRAAALGLPGDPAALRAHLARRERARIDAGRRDLREELLADQARRGRATVDAAGARLSDLAAEIGLAPGPGPGGAAALQDWRTAYDEASARRAKRELLVRSRRDQFGETPLAELRARAEAAAGRAGTLRARIAAGSDDPSLDEYLRSWPEETEARERRTASQASATEATAVAAAARARLEAVADPGVAEAEERLAAAEIERDRLVDLDDTLTRTIEFLDRARDQVHASIAPRLNAAVASMLPAATVGRYTEVMVDPSDLAVRVRASGGPLREARLLSFGTAEQIYLLLRIALAECLVAPEVSCPLIFDDVTVHADSERTAALLDLLLAASQRHQVIVFTQQDQVRDWAARALSDSTRHQSISLPTLAA